MRYKIRRVTLGSTLRVAFTLGWLVALCPALGLAAVAVQVLRRAGQALAQVQPIEIEFFGQDLLRIDILEALRLDATARTIVGLASNETLAFAMIALVLTVLGAAVFVVAGLLFGAGYNLLAGIGGGLEIELTGQNQEPRIENRR